MTYAAPEDEFKDLRYTGPDVPYAPGDPNAPKKVVGPPLFAQPPTPPAAPPTLYESMLKRMTAVQSGQPDPGNADLYGFNQTVPGASPTNPTGVPGGVPPGTPTAPTGPAATNIKDQATAASTYSNNPGGAPLANTTNQGTQDVVRNSYLQQATQGTVVDRNDANFKQQLDPFVAHQDRARRQYESEQAERLSAQGLGNSGAMQNERRLGAERAGQASGAFESQLVTRELENRRDEIKESLAGLRGMISDDQTRALQKQLAELDAAIKREGIAAGVATAGSELALKDKLGTGGLSVDLMRALLQNQQYGAGLNQDQNQFLDRLGFDTSGRQADWDWKQRNP